MSEFAFVNSFVNSLTVQKSFVRSGSVYEQLETSCGIPDMVVVTKKDSRSLNYVSRKYRRHLVNGHARVLATLKNTTRGHDIDKIYNHTRLSKKYIKNILDDLYKDRIIKEVDGRYKVTDNFNIPKIEITVVEFKLHDWKSALRQALKYKPFSSKVMIMMPCNKKRLLENNRHIFKQFNVGAAVFDQENERIHFVQKARRRRIPSDEKYIDTLGRIFQHHALDQI